MAALQPQDSPLAPAPQAPASIAPPTAVPTPTPRPVLASDSSGPLDDKSGMQTEEVTVSAEKKPDAPPISPKGLAERQQDLQDNVTQIQKDADGFPLPPAPKFDPPPTPKHTNPVEAWGSTAMLLAGIGSLLTRAPLTTALNAAAGVMNAYKAGDKEEAERQFAVWKENNDQAVKTQTYQMETYKAVQMKAHNNIEELIAMTNSYAAAFKDDTMLKAMSERNVLLGKKIVQDGIRNRNLLDRYGKQVVEGMVAKERYKTITTSKEYQEADPAKKSEMLMGVTDGGLVPQAAYDLMADTYIKTRKVPPLKKDQASRFWAAVGHKTVALNESGVSNDKIIAGQSGFAASAASLQGVKKLNSMSQAFERVVLKNMKVAEQRMPKGGAQAGLGPFFNQWLQSGRTEFGDTKVPAFDAAMVTLANEYAKVMSGSMGAAAATEGARNEAAALINKYYSKGQIKELFTFMRTEMRNKTVGYYEQERGLREELTRGSFDTEEDVGRALQSGFIDAEDAKAIWEEQFGVTE